MENENKISRDEYIKNLFHDSASSLLEKVRSGEAVFLPNKKSLEFAKSENSPVTQYPKNVRKATNGNSFAGMTQIFAQQALKNAGIEPTENNFDLLSYDEVKTKLGANFKNYKEAVKINLPFMAQDKDGVDRNYYHTLFSASEVKEQNLLPKIADRRHYTVQEFKPENANVSEYLGKYLAAAKQGGKFITTKKLAAEFKDNIEKELSQVVEQGNYKKLFEMGKEASSIANVAIAKLYHANDFMPKEEYIAKKNQEKEQKKAKTQTPQDKTQSFSMAD